MSGQAALWLAFLSEGTGHSLVHPVGRARSVPVHWWGDCTTRAGLQVVLECSGASLIGPSPERQERRCAARSGGSARYIVANLQLEKFVSRHAAAGHALAKWVLKRLRRFTAHEQKALQAFGLCAPQPCQGHGALWDLVVHIILLQVGPVPPELRRVRFPPMDPRRIEFTTLLEARLRPIMRTCEEVGPQSQMQRRKLCTQDGCDNYTSASECLIYDGGYGSNACYWRTSPDRWYCPMSAPVAALIPPKVGSTSNSEWLALMDDKLWHHKEQLLKSGLLGNCSGRRMWSSACASGTHRLRNAIRNRMQDLHGCTADHTSALVERALQTLEISNGLNMHLTGPYCHTCCSTAARRVRVVFVRNPFSRLASHYLSEWRHRMTFFEYLEHASCDRTFDRRCKHHPDFGRSERLHAKPVAHVLQELPPPGGDGAAELHVIHLELLRSGMESLVQRLCERFGFCALPRPPHKNKGPGEVKTDAAAVHEKPSQGDWLDLGPGKCNGTAPLVLFSGHLPGGLQRCKAECRRAPECGFVSHGWDEDPSLCLVLTVDAPCGDVAKRSASRKRVHRVQHGVRTYRFVPPPSLWDEQTRAKVLQWHAADFDAFGYSPDPASRVPANGLQDRCGPFRLVM